MNLMHFFREGSRKMENMFAEQEIFFSQQQLFKNKQTQMSYFMYFLDEEPQPINFFRWRTTTH